MRRSFALAMASIMFLRKQPAERGSCADAKRFSMDPAEPVTIGRLAAGHEVRPIVIVVDQIAAFLVAGQEVRHVALHRQLMLRAVTPEDAQDGVGNRGDAAGCLIGAT
jgi:hypothetical protein